MTHRHICHALFIALLLLTSLVHTATAQTPPANVVQIPPGWDVNNDGVLNYIDVDAKAGELAGMTSYLKMHGGEVKVTAE